MKKLLIIFYTLGISGFTGLKENSQLDVDIGIQFLPMHNFNPEDSITIPPGAVEKVHENQYIIPLACPYDSGILAGSHEKKFPHLVHTHNMHEWQIQYSYLYCKPNIKNGHPKDQLFQEMIISDPSILPLLWGNHFPG